MSFIGWSAALVEVLALCLVLASCGDGEPAPPRAAPPAATPTPTPTATPPPALAAPEPDEGDEKPISVGVRVRVTEERTFASRRVVAAFLPLRFRVVSRIARPIEVVVIQSGTGGGTVGRVDLKAGGRGIIRVQGLKPGSAEVASPDLDPDQTAIIAVRPGG